MDEADNMEFNNRFIINPFGIFSAIKRNNHLSMMGRSNRRILLCIQQYFPFHLYAYYIYYKYSSRGSRFELWRDKPVIEYLEYSLVFYP